jgi:hypothetical protein
MSIMILGFRVIDRNNECVSGCKPNEMESGWVDRNWIKVHNTNDSDSMLIV